MPRLLRGEVWGSLGRSVPALLWGRYAGGFAVKSAVKQRRILHPALRALPAPWLESDPPYLQVLWEFIIFPMMRTLSCLVRGAARR